MATTDDHEIVLHYAPDNASLIVRLLLEELALPYRTELVDRSVNAQTSAEYLKLNPAGLIPVCIINGEPVFETAAIVLSLADQHQRFLLPAGHARRSQFLKWLFFLSNSLHSDLRQRFYPAQYVGNDAQAVRLFSDRTLQRLINRFEILDTAYVKEANPYLFGTEPTIVDMYLAVCFRWAQLYPVKTGPVQKGPEKTTPEFPAKSFSAIVKMVEQLESRPAIRDACAKDGISGKFFSSPSFANPSEGVAL